MFRSFSIVESFVSQRHASDRLSLLSVPVSNFRTMATNLRSRGAWLKYPFFVSSRRVFTVIIAISPGLGHSTRRASSGEIELARTAGIKEAANVDNPSATIATSITWGLYGFRP